MHRPAAAPARVGAEGASRKRHALRFAALPGAAQHPVSHIDLRGDVAVGDGPEVGDGADVLVLEGPLRAPVIARPLGTATSDDVGVEVALDRPDGAEQARPLPGRQRRLHRYARDFDGENVEVRSAELGALGRLVELAGGHAGQRRARPDYVLGGGR